MVHAVTSIAPPSPRAPAATPVRGNPATALACGLDHLEGLQWRRGCWAGEMKWSTILTSQYVIAAHLTHQQLEPEHRARILTHLRREQLADGSWGLHPE